jgi:hypothetical protein
MNDEKHLTEMEKQVRDFRLVYVGSGSLEGGFGPLPHSDSMSERIKNLHIAMDNFKLVGNGFDVAGSFDKGFMIS